MTMSSVLCITIADVFIGNKIFIIGQKTNENTELECYFTLRGL